MYEKKLQASITGAGLAGEFAEAVKEISKSNLAGEDVIAIALCLVAQEIRNLALHVMSAFPPEEEP